MASACEPWPVLGCDLPAGATDPAILDAATAAAQRFLNGITGGRLGVCTYTQRFQVRGSDVRCRPALSNGQCCAIPLPRTPVREVLSVKIDGVALDPDEYHVLRGNRLTRVSGCWPSSSDCEPGRVVVTYRAGIPLTPPVYDESEPPELITPESAFYGAAGAAMGEIVREYVDGMCGKPCRLPSRFVAVARQGVSTAALDPALFLRLSLTGLPMTDNLVRTVNPNGLKRRPRVVSIDGPRQH